MPVGDNFTHVQTRPFEPTDPKIWISGLVANVINFAHFSENRSEGLVELWDPEKWPSLLKTFITLTTV